MKDLVKMFERLGLFLILVITPLAACRASDEAAQDRWASRRAELVSSLKRDGIEDAAVLKAIGQVPRHLFVPEAWRSKAYRDRPLPIGLEQTISQPWIVAHMSASLKLVPGQKVLEVGTGSGYQAAVLAELGAEVYSVEIIAELARRSAALLERLGYAQVHVRSGDGFDGWPAQAPFDAVIVTAAPLRVPRPLVEQLKEGGRLAIPVGPAHDQRLFTYVKREGKLVKLHELPVRFVPMTGKARKAQP